MKENLKKVASKEIFNVLMASSCRTVLENRSNLIFTLSYI